MSFFTDIKKYREMQKMKPMREHLRELISAGIVEESKLDELKKYDKKILKHSEKVRKYIASEKKYYKTERDAKKKIRELKKEMKEMRKNAFKKLKEDHPILGNIITLPLRIPIVGDLIKRAGFQFSTEYQDIKSDIEKLKDQQYEAGQKAYEAMLDLKKAERKEAEYREGRLSFFGTIEQIYQDYEEKLPILSDIHQNISELEALEKKGHIPAEFVTLSKNAYDKIKADENVEDKEGKPLNVSDLIATIKEVGLTYRMKQEINLEQINKINKFLGNSEPVEKKQKEEKKEEKLETGKETKERAEAPEEKPESSHPSKDKRRDMKGELTARTLFVNSFLLRDDIAAIAGDPEALCEELGNGSAKDGLVILESAIKAAQKGESINYDQNPVLKEVVNDYMHYLEMRSQEEASAKDREVMGTAK